MRLHFSIVAFVLFTVVEAFADTLNEIQQRLSEREQRLHNLCFLYQLDYTIDWHGEEAHSYTHRGGSFMLSLCRSANGITKVAFHSNEKFNSREFTISSEQLAKLIDTSYWEWWYGDGWLALSQRAVSGNLQTVTIFPCIESSIHCDMHRGNLDYNFTRFDTAILGNFNLLKATDIRWRIASDSANQWTLLGEYEAQVGQRGTVRIVLAKAGAQVQSVEILEAYRHAGQEKVTLSKKWRIVELKTVNQVAIPQKILMEKRAAYATIRSVARLVKVLPLAESLSPHFSLGASVTDYRLADYAELLRSGSIADMRTKAVSYAWQGRLYTIDELRALAYQQGNLIPPDAPRRRFSLLLFVPAIVFFALAAYLYFKNRRR